MRRVVYLCLLLQQIVSFARAQCSVPTVNALHHKSPVMLGFNNFFKYPNIQTYRSLTYDWYEDRVLYCPGGQLGITVNGAIVPLNAVPAQPYALPPVVRCVDGENFILQHSTGYQANVRLDQFTCSEQPTVVSVFEEPEMQCSNINGNIGKMIHLGFEIDAQGGKGQAVIRVCYEDARATTIWTKHSVPPSINGRVVMRKDNGDPVDYRFVNGEGFQGISIKKLYESCTQKLVFRELLREFVFVDENGNPIDERMLLPNELNVYNTLLDDEAARYIHFDKEKHREDNRMLVKGHLSPRADFFYLVEERSTFFYANALPMWDSINGGHWSKMETLVRHLAAENNCHLQVWTGGHGVLKVEGKDVYLGQRSGEPVVPVPLILFKIVWCETSNEAIVFVAINNPDLEIDGMNRDDYIYCRNEYLRCAELYPEWSEIPHKGFVYCCEYEDFVNHEYIQEMGIKDHIPIKTTPVPLIADV